MGSFTFFDIFDQKPKRELTSLFPALCPSDPGRCLSLPSPPHTHTHARTHPSGGVPPDGVPIRVGVAGTVPWPVVPIRVGAVVTTTPMRPPSSLGWTPCLPSPGRISTEEERRCWEPRCPPATGEANKVLNQKKKQTKQ